MEILTHVLIVLSDFFRPYLGAISTVYVSTLLVIYGNDINRKLKQIIRGKHLLIRYFSFIILCAFGYGALLIFLAPLIAKQLHHISALWLSPAIVIIFLVLGVLAERKNQL